jgi:hypothetical protein
MKFNKEVWDLARKLDYMLVEPEDRRDLIKKCLNPLGLIGGLRLIAQINYNYEHLKKGVAEYQKLDKRQREIEEIRYIAPFN